jgi:hypothetical protein
MEQKIHGSITYSDTFSSKQYYKLMLKSDLYH